jgi:hypothetical protein
MTLNEIAKSCVKTVARMSGRDIYAEDGLITIHNHTFLEDREFSKAYERGIAAAQYDHQFRWRVHVALWVASNASKLEGDFVECGVNFGVMSSAMMAALNWDSLNKKFFLLDTFQGMDERFVSEAEKQAGYLEANKKNLSSKYYVSKIESVKQNFAEWKNISIIQGSVPETLEKVDSQKIAYLHLDMNCSFPEVAALKFFWDKMVSCGLVLFDDYANANFKLSKIELDQAAAELKVQILSLPTGQGLIIRPPH